MAALRLLGRWFDRRRRAIAVLLLGWTAVIVVSAGPEAAGSEWLALPDLSGVLAALLLLAALGGLVFLLVVRPQLRAERASRPASSLRGLLLLTLGVMVAALVIGQQEPTEHDLLRGEDQPAETRGIGEDVPTIAAADSDDTDDAISLLLVLAVGAGAVLWWTHRRLAPGHDADTAEESELVAELGPAVGEALVLLNDGNDPRSSVMAAYATLEAALAERGHGRNPTETAAEHMARVLGDVPVLSAPAVRLGGLYERARFSAQRITAADRYQAARALEEARTDLAITVPEAR